MSNQLSPRSLIEPDATKELSLSMRQNFDPYFLPNPTFQSRFPLASVPIPIRSMLRDASIAWGTHPSYLFISSMALVLGLVGDRCQIEVSPTHSQASSVFALLVGGTRTGKSQALKRFITLCMNIELEEATRELPDFSDALIKKQMRYIEKQFDKQVHAAIDAGDEIPEPSAILKAWIYGRREEPLFITEASKEGLDSAAKNSKFGLIVIADEAADFLGGPGGDRRQQGLFSAFDSTPSRKTLSATGDSRGRATTVSFAGATTPVSLQKTGMTQSKGFAGRAIVAYETSPPERRKPEQHEIEAGDELLARLVSIRRSELPNVLELSEPAKSLIKSVTSRLSGTAHLGPTAAQDAIAGADAILYRMSAAIHLLIHPNGGSTCISNVAANSACKIYEHYILPAIVSLAVPADQKMRDLILQFCGRLIEIDKTDRVNRRLLMRNRQGLDFRGFKFLEFETELFNKRIATLEHVQRGEKGGRPEAFIVLNPDYIAQYKRTISARI